MLVLNLENEIREEIQTQLMQTNAILDKFRELNAKLPESRSKFDLTKSAMLSLPRVDNVHAELLDPKYLVGFGDIEWDFNNCLACASCQEICPESAVNLVNEWDLPAVFEMADEDLESLPENRRKLIHLVRKLAVKKPSQSIKLPKDTLGFGKVQYNPLICIACRKCEEKCPNDALKFNEFWNFPDVMKTLIEEG